MENLVRPPAAGGQIDEGNKIRQYWHVVLERRWLIVTTFAVVVILGAVYAFRATPIYEAALQLRIDPERGGALALADIPQVSGRDQDYFQTELKGTTRRVALERLIDELDLATNPRYSDSADTVSAVLEDISVLPVRMTRLVSIKVRNPDPKLAARMANTLATINLELNQTAKMESSLEGFRLLREEQQTQEAELEAAIQELQDYRVKKGAVSLETDANFVTRGLMQAKEAYDTQRAAADVAETSTVAQRKLPSRRSSTSSSRMRKCSAVCRPSRDTH